MDYRTRSELASIPGPGNGIEARSEHVVHAQSESESVHGQVQSDLQAVHGVLAWRRRTSSMSTLGSLVTVEDRQDADVTTVSPIQVEDTAVVGFPRGEDSSAPPLPAAVLVVGSSTFTFNEFVNCLNFATNRQQRILPQKDVRNAENDDHAHGDGLMLFLAIDGKRVDQTYPWRKGGFCLYLMTLPEDLVEMRINIETGITGSYHFPTNAKLVSAIYNIKANFSAPAKLEFEHCFSGDSSILAFVYCESSHPPYYFKVAHQDDHQHSFTATHGVIETGHFSCWGIIVWIKEAINRGYELLPISGASVDEDEDVKSDPQGSLRIKVICFCRVETSHIIKVNLAILKQLTERTEVVKQKYQQEGWRLIMEIGDLKFAEASTTKVYISMEPLIWSNVGSDGWKVRPGTNPKVERSLIEGEEKKDSCAIQLQYKLEASFENQTLDHSLKLEGLNSGDEPLFVNLLIDAGSRYTCTRPDSKPSLTNLRCFKGKTGIMNVIDEIGDKYHEFGVHLLNDETGSYMSGVVAECHENSARISTKVLTEWINGRPNGLEHSWWSLISTLKNIGLKRLAEGIEATLLNV